MAIIQAMSNKNRSEIEAIKAELTKAIAKIDGCNNESFVFALLEKAADISTNHTFFNEICSEVGWTYLLPRLIKRNTETIDNFIKLED